MKTFSDVFANRREEQRCKKRWYTFDIRKETNIYFAPTRKAKDEWRIFSKFVSHFSNVLVAIFEFQCRIFGKCVACFMKNKWRTFKKRVSHFWKRKWHFFKKGVARIEKRRGASQKSEWQVRKKWVAQLQKNAWRLYRMLVAHVYFTSGAFLKSYSRCGGTYKSNYGTI